MKRLLLVAIAALLLAILVWAFAARPVFPADYDARIAVMAYCNAVAISESACITALDKGLTSNPQAAPIIMSCKRGNAGLFASCIKAAGVYLP